MAYTTIDDSSAYFQVAKWAGNSQGDSVASRTITNDGNSDLQPDMLWTIPTDIDSYNWIYDSTRGFLGSKAVTPAYDWAQSSAPNTGGYPSAATSDGFTVVKGSSGTVATEYVNQAAHQNGTTSGHATSYVAYQWKANGGTTSNLSANIDSVVQANTTSGVSIVTYTGNGSVGQSIAHGLGVIPAWILVKRLDGTADWFVYHQSTGNTTHMHLNTTANLATTSDWGNYGPNANYFYVNNTGPNVNTDEYVAYCFAEIQGFSKFGIYEGIAAANGPFIYTGFKPAWVMVKNIDNGGYNWALIDHKRTPFNGEGVAKWFWPDLADKEFTDTQSGIDMDMDLLSNGFKITTARAELNLASTFIYMAFAESPFVTSDGVPVTGR